MPVDPSTLWTWNRKIDRLPYLLAGVAFFLVKYPLDWSVANYLFHQPWSPYNYLIWPNLGPVDISELSRYDNRFFLLTMLGIALPFIWIGVFLTSHRLRAAGLPITLIGVFFIPVINLFLFLLLVLIPSRRGAVTETGIQEISPTIFYFRGRPIDIAKRSKKAAMTFAILGSVPICVGFVAFNVIFLQSYGMALFIGMPFVVGMSTTLLFGLGERRELRECLGVATLAVTLVGVGILLVAIEGIICLLMAAPLVYPLALLGAVVGYNIQNGIWMSYEPPLMCLAIFALLPSIMAIEAAHEPALEVRLVQTTVDIDAPPEKVWRNVIAFEPLPEPTEWFFRTGIAYPKSAEISGAGSGAIRRCIFSTGTFVEPIDVWDEPNLLRFQVTDQPPPMKEWTFVDIHPPHLDQYLDCRQGQFRLIALGQGKTRLEGTTWYTNRMWPNWYFNLWSDQIIHEIHVRVLDHIKTLACSEDL